MSEPFMPTAELTDDMLINTGRETITWGALLLRRDAQGKVDAITPELVERMVTLVRRMSERAIAATPGLVPAHGFPDFYEARAIAELLPEPVDPDLIEATKINDWSPYDLTEMDPRAAQRVVEQVRDAILAGIKRGRALATPATSA